MLGSSSGKSKNDRTLYVDDNFTVPAGSSGIGKQYVYIVSAPGLAKVQMVIFRNSYKVSELLTIAGQFDKGYYF